VIIVGIDPGFSGAIALLRPADGWLELHDMPVFPGSSGGRPELNHHEVLAILQSIGAPSVAWLERVSARPGQCVSTMFRFGQGYGALEMACAASGCAVRYVTPLKWKRHFSLTAAKDMARGEACRRVPGHAPMFKRKMDDGRAEAALIALYGSEVGR
jgi:crossover junction endodeoxyribonuclease RuvC